MNPIRLATLLADRVRAVLPDGGDTVVEPTGGISVSHAGHWTTVGFGLLVADGSPEALYSGVWQVLSIAQDAVSESLREPWPPAPGPELALPEVRVEAGRIVMWFGDEDSPALRLDDLPLGPVDGDGSG